VPRAIGYYKEALEVDREIGNQREIAADLSRLGWAYSITDNMSQAIKYFEEAMTIYRKIEDVNGIVSCSAGLAGAYAQENDFERAVPLANEAVRLGDKIKHPLAQNAKQLLVELQNSEKEGKDLINQVLQAFMNVTSPLEMQALVRQYPFITTGEFIQALGNDPNLQSAQNRQRLTWLKQIANKK
jgi:tetratricopeptide (TPR) repeat protein